MGKYVYDVAKDVYIRALMAGCIVIGMLSIFWTVQTQRVAYAWEQTFNELEQTYDEGMTYWNSIYKDMEQQFTEELKEKESLIQDMESQLESLYHKANQVRIASVSDDKKRVVEQLPGSILTVEATAYTADCTGCSGITYTGIDVRNKTPKIIAVDPDVIPLGKKVELIVDGKSWGTWETQDVGSDIKGLRIDILMESVDKALEFGRQTVQLKILD